MAVVTATQVTNYTSISASAATIASSGLIPIIQDRIAIITNNYFTTGIYIVGSCTFSATDGTVIVAGSELEDTGFIAGDDIYIYYSHRNDGYFTLDSVSGSTLTIVSSGSAFVAEPTDSTRSIQISVVRWPRDVTYAAAQMVKYDYDDRSKQSPGVRSRSLGPFSESYSDGGQSFGYPDDILSIFDVHKVARLM